ncbi:hypothetical protein KBD45_02145 [Candidatus Dojkabacteria bacterium]|nr:hypothetical protein [Candidatus Dojkabacteria bacterium]
MYLYKVRKSPAEGFSVNLSTFQMVFVIILFVLFFVGPVWGFNQIGKINNPEVKGISIDMNSENDNTKQQIFNITKTAAIGSSILLISCLVLVYVEYYKKNRNFEL